MQDNAKEQNQSPFGGIVLCGGRSTRMGRPKHLLPFGPETLLQRVVRRMQEVVSPVVVVAAADQELPSLPEDVLVGRDDVEGRGPLGGLAKGLALMSSHRPAAFVSSCDAPFLEPAFIRRMLAELGEHDLAIPREASYYHPLAAVYRVSLEKSVRELIAANRLRPFFLIESCQAKIVDVEDLRDVDPQLATLRNTNHPEDYEQALKDAGFAPQE
jgi:molybdopterin-guanine dinucleotide biosynthesis protein A